MCTLPVRPRSSTRRQVLAVALIVALELVLPGTRLFTFVPLPASSAGDKPGVTTQKPVKARLIGPNISITTLGTPITQNFDTLVTTGTANAWADDSTLPGWFSQFSLQPTNPTTYRADSGGSNTGAIYSWGIAGTNPLTERAFGSIGSGTPGDIFNAIKLTNNTGQTITSLLVSYNGEQWRQGGCTPTPCTPASQKLDFQYQVANAGVITDSNTPSTGWVDQDPLDFTSPAPGTSTAAALDGNAAANRTALSSTITVTVNDGQEVWLRWKDTNDANNDHGLGIDDVSVTANGGAVTPTLNIGDVTQAEGNASTSTFSFNVSLTAPAGAGGVSFAVNTADGTTNPANAGSDYVAIVAGAGSISSGNSSTTVSVTVNGDTTPEPDETFFVNISGVTNANAGDVQGLGTITNDDVTLTAIHSIQGSGTASPLAGQLVTTTGIVTGLKSGSSGGFFIQEPDASVDADPNTSEGIFVFTGASIPGAAAIGNLVQVSATVQEFVFSSDPNSPPITELSSVTSTSLLSTGNSLPTPITLTVANTTAPSATTNPLDSLEEFEGMRVTVPSLTVVAPTDGTINEPNATVSGNDVFYGVVTGVPRPFRQPGVNISDPLPPGSPVNVPRFDENPERIRVDSDGQPGTTAVDVNAGSLLSNVTGPLDYQFRTYTILPDVTLTPGAQPGSVPAPTPLGNELTVASFNMERFFDTANDPTTSDPVLTQVAFDKRLDKASRIIRTVQRYPDVIGVQEMENLTTLQAVAAKLNADAQSIDLLPNPNYVAYLVEGNDVGGIDVGFLVKESRVTTVSVTQFNKTETFVNPNTGASETLNDRPPLVLRATAPRPAGGTFAFTVIVNHLRSLSGIDDTTPNGSGTEGSRIRAKRQAQAVSLANLIQSFQTADSAERIITLGDMNAFPFNDGYADVIGTVKGTPSADDQTVVPGDGADLVNPDLTNLSDTLPASERYSFTFDGNAQVLDQIVVNDDAFLAVTRFAYARDDADFAVKNYELANELRLSDHDQPIVYLSLGGIAGGSVIISEFRFHGTDGTPDEYIELYNTTNAAITVNSVDGTSGWALSYLDSSGTLENIAVVIPNGTVIPARGHYLVANEPNPPSPQPNGITPSGEYSLDSYAAADLRYRSNEGFIDIPDNSAIALFQTANVSNFSLTTRLDAASLNSAVGATADLYREGTSLPSPGANAGQYAFVRKLVTGAPQDTNNNLADFVFVSTTGGSYGGVQSQLGAPGPENALSPIQRNSTVKASLIEPGASSSAAPNRVRDLTPVTNGTLGTLSIRRRFINQTGQPITRLRFRFVDITTLNSPGYSPGGSQADVRAIDGSDFSITTSLGMLTVRGLTVEQPSPLLQPNGGGLNSSVTVALPGGAIAPGATIDIHFLLGVQQGGTFRAFVNVEALP